MNSRKYVAVFFVCVFLLSSVLPQASAQPDGTRIIDKILIAIFEKTVYNPLFPWSAGVMRIEPEQWSAEPSSVDIEFLNRSEIIIGLKNATTGEYMLLSEKKLFLPYFPSEEYEFKLEIPADVPKGSFIPNFDPPILRVGEEGEFKTKLTIISNAPRNASLPEIITLKLNVSKYMVGGNLYKARENASIIDKLTWPILAIVVGFGPRYSGKRFLDQSVEIDIIVRAKRFHLVEIMPPPSHVELKPDKLISIPLEIRNLGSHLDTFNFRVNVDNDSGLLVAPPPAMTLYPNEVGRTIISVATPRNFRDPGTVHPIYVEAYSIYEPDKVFGNTVTIVTRGMYVSEINTTYLTLFGLVIILVVAFFLYRRKRMLGKICRKPDKPWNILEEKKYLEKLKTKDKKEYNRVFRLMEDEYKSSLLWYKFYCKAELSKVREKKKLVDIPVDVFRVIVSGIGRFVSIFKRPGRKMERPREIEPEVLRVENRELVDKMSEIDERKKEQVILKIKKTQERQRRKYMKSSY